MAIEKKIKVFVVDDHDFFRKTLIIRLNKLPGIEITGEANNGEIFLQKLSISIPDVVLMDIRMPKLDGIEATKLALDLYPHINVLALTLHQDVYYLHKMMEAGAKGFLFKNSDETIIDKAIKTVYTSGFFFSQSVKDII